MTYYHYLLENHLRSIGFTGISQNQELINVKAENALQEFESLRLSGLDVNNAQEIVTTNLFKNLNQLID